MTDTSPAAIVKLDNKTKAMKLRREGWSYQDIGDDLGVSDDTARNYVIEGLKAIEWIRDEEAIEVREMAKSRNNDALKAIYEKVLAGDLNAIDRLIKLNEQLLEMVGAKITKHDITSGGSPLASPIHTVEVMLDYGAHSPVVSSDIPSEG